jgi:benzoyl-CoA reductase subunit BamC
MCVQACKFDALIYEEREEEVAEPDTSVEESRVELKSAYESLVKQHGLKKVMDTFSRLSSKH